MNPRFPIAFVAAKEALAQFCSAQACRASLLAVEADVIREKEKLPQELVPFLVVEEPSCRDLYAFDFSFAPPTVVVWSDHAVVERWESFEAFLCWARDKTTNASDGKAG